MLVDITQMSPILRLIAGFNCPKSSCDQWAHCPGGGDIVFTHIHVFSAPREFDEFACDANWVSWLVQSVWYMTPGPISQAEAVTSEALWAVKSDSQPPRASQQSMMSAPLQMCYAPVVARWHLFSTSLWLVISTLADWSSTYRSKTQAICKSCHSSSCSFGRENCLIFVFIIIIISIFLNYIFPIK